MNALQIPIERQIVETAANLLEVLKATCLVLSPSGIVQRIRFGKALGVLQKDPLDRDARIKLLDSVLYFEGSIWISGHTRLACMQLYNILLGDMADRIRRRIAAAIAPPA